MTLPNPILYYIHWCCQPKPDNDKYWWALQTLLLPFSMMMILLQLAWEEVMTYR